MYNYDRRTASASFWADAVEDIEDFNRLYSAVERKPDDVKALGRCLNQANKSTKLFIWAKKALTAADYAPLLTSWRLVGKLVKDRSAAAPTIFAALQDFRDAVQTAIGSTAPAAFTYQGFSIGNEEHFSDALCRLVLSGVDVLRALFKKRGVSKVLDQGLRRIDLVYEVGGSASFNSGTGVMTLSVEDLSKGRPGRFIDSFVGEAIIHEFGHYVHRNFIRGEAAAVWDAPWEGLQSLADPKNRAEPDREERLRELEIVTDYGKTDKYEDFAETFLLFIVAPEKLTRTAKHRLERALSVSGLYGKTVVERLAAAYLSTKPSSRSGGVPSD